jgi:hypothetical protein
VVLWTNEENGLRGAEAYREWAGSTVANHVAAIEMDGGAERPLGFGLSALAAGQAVQDRALAQAQQVGALLAGIGAQLVIGGGGGADIGPLMREGVPGLGLRTTGEKYFHWHHTHADTIDHVDPEHFRLCMATVAVMAWGLAEMEPRLGVSRPPATMKGMTLDELEREYDAPPAISVCAELSLTSPPKKKNSTGSKTLIADPAFWNSQEQSQKVMQDRKRLTAALEQDKPSARSSPTSTPCSNWGVKAKKWPQNSPARSPSCGRPSISSRPRC